MKKLFWIIIKLILGLFMPKPQSLGDKIEIEDRELKRRWKRQLRKLIDERRKAQEDASKAYVHWAHHPNRDNWAKYIRLRKHVESIAHRINEHHAHRN
jgi:predicted Holliday junction resolvase-like endonuclease